MSIWNPKSELAAVLTAHGLPLAKIAERVALSERTIKRWRQEPEFRAKVQELREALLKRFATEGYARKENRIALRRRLLNGITAGFAARGGRPDRGGAEWDQSGLYVQREKSLNIGQGVFEPITEFELDTGAIGSVDELLREIAVEVGDYKVKVDHTVQIDPVPRKLAEIFTEEEIQRAIERLNAETAAP